MRPIMVYTDLSSERRGKHELGLFGDDGVRKACGHHEGAESGGEGNNAADTGEVRCKQGDGAAGREHDIAGTADNGGIRSERGLPVYEPDDGGDKRKSVRGAVLVCRRRGSGLSDGDRGGTGPAAETARSGRGQAIDVISGIIVAAGFRKDLAFGRASRGGREKSYGAMFCA